MKAEVRIAPDGGLMIYVPSEEIRKVLYDVPQCCCGVGSFPFSLTDVPHLIGTLLDVVPQPPVRVLNDFGLLGLPARLSAILDECGDSVSSMLSLVPEPRPRKMSLASRLLPADICSFGDFKHKRLVKKFHFVNINGKKLFCGILSQDDDTTIIVRGDDDSAPSYYGSGYLDGNPVKIAISGVKSPGKLVDKLGLNLDKVKLKETEGK